MRLVSFIHTPFSGEDPKDLVNTHTLNAVQLVQADTCVAGTLTLNKLSVDSETVLTLGNHSVDEVLKYSALSAQIDSEEAIDIVLVNSYPGKDTMWNGLKQSKFVPFNPVDKYTIAHVFNTSTEQTYRLLKGAPQVGRPGRFNLSYVVQAAANIESGTENSLGKEKRWVEECEQVL